MSPALALTLVASIAGIGGFLFGYDTAVIAGAVGALREHFGLTAAQQGWVGASAIYGCLPDALAAGFLADAFGRKRLLLLCAALYAISGIWSALPSSLIEFLTARFLGGIGIGISSMPCPTYIAEIAPERKRGLLGTLFQLGIVTGIFLVFFVNQRIQSLGDAAWNASIDWRLMLGSEFIPAVFFLCLLFLVPESPRWLLLKGRAAEARVVVEKFFEGPEVESELNTISRGVEEREGRFSDLFSQAWRRPLLIAVFLAILSQFSGINAIMYYPPEVFKSSGASTSSAFASAVWVGTVNLAFTLVAMLFIDRAGRRPLLIIGAAMQTLALTAVGWSFLAVRQGPVTLIAVLAYIAAFAMAMGPIPWVLIAENFPSSIRGRAVSVGVGTIWAGCLVVAQTFPLLNEVLGPAVTFWIYGGCSLISLLFVLRFVPETKGQSLEQIAASWKAS